MLDEQTTLLSLFGNRALALATFQMRYTSMPGGIRNPLYIRLKEGDAFAKSRKCLVFRPRHLLGFLKYWPTTQD